METRSFGNGTFCRNTDEKGKTAKRPSEGQQGQTKKESVLHPEVL